MVQRLKDNSKRGISSDRQDKNFAFLNYSYSVVYCLGGKLNR